MNIYVTKSGQQSGPYNIEQINAEATAGRVTSDDLAWMEGWSSWQLLSTVPGFIPASPPPAPTTSYPPLPPAHAPTASYPPPPPLPPVHGSDAAPQQSPEHENLVRLFIDKNYEYFTAKWKQAEHKKSKNSWNWTAFCLGLLWMVYRKMYSYSWIFIGVMVGEGICESAFGFPKVLSNAINMGIFVTCGLQGNHWYKLHVEKKLREIAPADVSTEAIRLRLAKEGGTNLGAAIGLFVGILLLIALAALAG